VYAVGLSQLNLVGKTSLSAWDFDVHVSVRAYVERLGSAIS
jgi:hypothetical protein